MNANTLGIGSAKTIFSLLDADTHRQERVSPDLPAQNRDIKKVTKKKVTDLFFKKKR